MAGEPDRDHRRRDTELSGRAEAREVDLRAEHHEEDRYEEAVRDADQLAGEALRAAQGGDGEADGEGRNERARADTLRDPGQSEDGDQRQPQVEGPLPVLRLPSPGPQVSDTAEPAKGDDGDGDEGADGEGSEAGVQRA